jgi:hypothetical protein
MRICLGTGGGFLGRFATIELCNDLGVDPIELLLREDAQERPSEIERLEDGTRLICT